MNWKETLYRGTMHVLYSMAGLSLIYGLLVPAILTHGGK